VIIDIRFVRRCIRSANLFIRQADHCPSSRWPHFSRPKLHYFAGLNLIRLRDGQVHPDAKVTRDSAIPLDGRSNRPQPIQLLMDHQQPTSQTQLHKFGIHALQITDEVE